LSFAVPRRQRSHPPIIIVIAMLASLFAFGGTAVSAPHVLGATTTKVARCNANLRTRPYLSARRRVTIKAAARVTVVAGVTGASWRVFCGGRFRSGRSWYRITAINGRSVMRLYGVRYLYAASALFKTPTVTSAWTPTTAPMPVPPTPGGRPFVAPVTARTVTVPSSVDATGGSDASAALNAFVASVPDGSVIAFKAGGTYRLDSGIRFANRHNLVFEGNGATLRPTGQTDSHGNSAFALWNWNTDIIIRNITIVGQNSRPGVYNSSTNENRAGVLIYGGSRIELANVTVLNPWSDYVMIGATVTSSGETPADSVWIHDSTMTGSGRMGIAAVTVTHLLIERVTFDLTAWVVLDIEPNSAAEEVGWVTFRDNAIKRGGSNLPGFVSARGGTGAWDAHDITITGNRTDGTLATDIDHIARRRNVVFTNNTAARSAAGPVLHLAHIDGLTVGGNVQPLSSGSLAAITDSTGVVVSP
jgi:hypothetical protein